LTSVIQSGAALLSGLLFIAIRLRTGSLWPAIIVHGLWDFGTFTLGAAGGQMAGREAAPTGIQMLLPLLLVLPNALYALWLLRHVGRTHARPED
jgi:membrane protease YdiL (CAAX protease family)